MSRHVSASFPRISPLTVAPVQNFQNDLSSLRQSVAMRDEAPERKSSKNSGGGLSFWSRKSLKRSNTTHSTSPPVAPPLQTASSDVLHGSDFGVDDDGKLFPVGTVSLLSHSRSFVPESTNNMSMFDDPLPDIPHSGFKVRYHIHNPLGPRWYKNHHLIPPSQIKPSMRPPTFFSPSFPPISTSSMPDNIGEVGLSSRASHSPLPTPTSSQTRVGEGVKPRSRKTSQTAPDNVDLLDVTDPWGTNWHHESPYDIGTPATSKGDLDIQGTRLRRASMTAAQNSFKAVIPSPLSQSTSAVHLPHDILPEKPPSEKPPSTINSTINIQAPRKLSKRKNPDLNGLFRPPTKEEHRKAASAPQTPVERIHLADSGTPDPGSLPKRMSVAPPVTYFPQITPKKEKRASFVDRIVKKFTMLRKSEDFGRPYENREYSWLHVNSDDISVRQSMDPGRRQSSPEKQEPVKRVPAPSAAPTPEVEKPPTPPPSEPRFSCISLEAPFSIGKLTIANPDAPNSEKGTPHLHSSSLPPQLTLNMLSPLSDKLPLPTPPNPLETSPLSPPPAIAIPPPGSPSLKSPLVVRNPSLLYDKPLPVPVPSTAGSTLGISTPSTEEDKQLEPATPDPAPLSRRATVMSTATVVPTTRQVAAPAPDLDSDSDSDSSSSSSSSSSSDDDNEVSSVSNRPVPPESTINANASTVSQAPTLPEKPTPAVAPAPPPTPPTTSTATPTIPATPTSTPKTPDTTPTPVSRVKSRVSAPNSQRMKTQEVPPPALSLPSLTNGVTAGVYPLAMPLSPEEMTSQDRINSYLSSADSPYSATSVLANPPTPYGGPSSALPSRSDLTSAPPPLPAKPSPSPKESKEAKKPSRDASPGQPTRQTETFKLVRNHSGNNIPTAETAALAAGQQWDIVESESKVKARPSKKDAKDHHRDREHPRKDSAKGETSSSRHNSSEEQQEKSGTRSQRQSRYQQEISSVLMPKMPVAVAGSSRHSTSYNRHLDDPPPARYVDEYRRYEEQPPAPLPRSPEESGSKQRGEGDRRRSEHRSSRDKEGGSKDDYRREEHRKREERRRYEEEKRYEEEQRQREKERERRRRERDREREREKEREKEREREVRALEWEMREREKEREREVRELERQMRERERELELEREREKERQRELKERERAEREKEKQRLKELEKEREREKERARELEREREREREREKERERGRLRELEKEKERLRELEREKIRELEKERVRLRELEKERERQQRELEKERERQQRELEREKEKEKEKERRRRERREEKSKRSSEYHPFPEEPRTSERASDDSRRRRKREDRKSEYELARERQSVYITPEQSRIESGYYGNGTQSIYLAGSSEGSRVERKPSTATRPTSELPSAADMNALRAKEAWDMERMWKARSMYGAELNGNAVQSIPAQSVLSFSDNLSTQAASYGSSHTAFTLQAPFQAAGPSSIYHSMPTKPPPIIYGSPASIPSLPDSLPYDPYDHNNFGNGTPTRQPRASYAPSPPEPLPMLSRTPLANNPLPEPPRESTYKPAPLPPMKPATTTVRTGGGDYWSKYASVTTAAS
ncbi:hypothetical protein DFP72DRAFT_1057747 [Ephemerocybe angulata]|uniref:Uncharacterized protein n=1 Tax=Ephemerocybe angulata TaxID=980116 RepID=A0A8H6IKT1_9AGAR|nr:hypothetical protein DFP72DRAFT_1057747 [Tulosesus angulatus]